MAQTQKVDGTADVVFLLDITDSMDYCIDAVKDNIEIFVKELQSKNIDWRARIIGFRNYDYDGENNWWDGDDSPFTSDVNELKKQLAAKKASGGDPNDFRESVLDALHKVANFNISSKLPPDPFAWRPTGHAAKCVLLFTDYAFQDYVSYVEGNQTKDDVVEVLNENRIRVCIIAPEFPCYAELAEEQDIDYEPCGPHEDFPAKIKSAGYFEKIIQAFAKTVTATATVEMY